LGQRCKAEVQEREDALCGIRKLRAELDQMSGATVEVQDCEVGEWVEGPCSESCGGGEAQWTRPVLTETDNGAMCPPTFMAVSCNTHECPQDCEVEDWSGWSACSKDCGGGVEQQARNIRFEAKGGGSPCPAASEERVCNVAECDASCQYSEWTAFSACSQVCGSGFSMRTRSIVAEAVGDGGACVEAHDAGRLQPKICNAHECPAGLECQSMLDIVVLMDGSGSVNEESLAEQKSGIEALIGKLQFGDDLVHAGAAIFGGSVSELSPLSGDAAAVTTGVNSAAANADPGTKLAPALEHAKSMLMAGREDAQNIVLVLLDGMPSDGAAAAQAAARMSENTRVIVIAAGSGMDLGRVAHYASFPAKLNVLAVHSFAGLPEENEVNRFVAGLCPIVHDPNAAVAATSISV